MWIVHWLLDTKVKVICSRVQLTPSFCVWLSYYSLFHLWQILLGLTLIHFNLAENLICQSSAYLSILASALYFFIIKFGFIFSSFKYIDWFRKTQVPSISNIAFCKFSWIFEIKMCMVSCYIHNSLLQPSYCKYIQCNYYTFCGSPTFHCDNITHPLKWWTEKKVKVYRKNRKCVGITIKTFALWNDFEIRQK